MKTRRRDIVLTIIAILIIALLYWLDPVPAGGTNVTPTPTDFVDSFFRYQSFLPVTMRDYAGPSIGQPWP